MQIKHLWHRYLVWHHGIIKKIVAFFLLFLTFIGGFIVSQIITKKELKEITAEKNTCISQLQQVVSQPKRVNEKDLNLYVQKTNALANIDESTLYFSPKISKQSPSRIEVVIMIIGGSGMKADASDLVMKYSNNLKIIEVLPGQAFPSYPRKVIGDGEITITAIATLGNNSVKLGEPNKPFATLIVEKTGASLIKGTISIDKVNTQIYLQGKPVFDPDKTFNQIEL